MPFLYVYFNTTLVLFKHDKEDLDLFNDFLFQYHTGSIQTNNNFPNIWLCIWFQYHTGSIQTGVFQVGQVGFQMNFNTTLVLFKHDNDNNKEMFITNFNTTLVLFKRILLHVYWGTSGKWISIPHWFYSNRIMWVWKNSGAKYFNTTLVLFKQKTRILDKTQKKISIPHWFYSNGYAIFCNNGNNKISIPHWFYSNKK